MTMLPPGVTVLERGWLSANNIVFTGPRGTAVVDTGYVSHAAQTVALVGGALAGRRLDLLVNTHLHSDHCGGNSALQQAHPGVRTLIPPGQAAHVRDWDPVALSYVPTGQTCPQFALDGVLEPGGVVTLGDSEWEVHAAPGHDPHSVILFHWETRTLISADALWSNGFGVVFQELEGDRAFDEVAATLDLIESLGPQVVIPGHGAVFTEVPQALSSARQRLDSFVRQPAKHATHSAKVLLKFKLLELQDVRVGDLHEWALGTPYFAMIHRRFFADIPVSHWISGLLEQLVKSGAAAVVADRIVNA